MSVKYQKPFLKWPGGKFRLLDRILAYVKPGLHCWWEPFVGSGAVFLNVNAEHYRLADVNPHLIQLYQTLQSEGHEFIQYVSQYFHPKYNTRNQYQALREQFNHTDCERERAALFLYLNRHGFNGLCRYNNKGLYNVPFGLYEHPYFPAEEMKCFYEKSKRVTFVCEDFKIFFDDIDQHDNGMLYADPPYIPLSRSAGFTHYAKYGFSEQDHQDLAYLSKQHAERGLRVLLSNHDTPWVRDAYSGASFERFAVKRHISGLNKGRGAVDEVLVLFSSQANSLEACIDRDHR